MNILLYYIKKNSRNYYKNSIHVFIKLNKLFSKLATFVNQKPHIVCVLNRLSYRKIMFSDTVTTVKMTYVNKIKVYSETLQ